MSAQEKALLVMWIVFALVSLAGVVAVLLWAVRARQFSRQDKARHLALRARTSNEERSQQQESGDR